MVVDEEAAEVVKEIFRLCMNGYGPTQISRLLSERGVESPTIYKKRKNLSIAVHETEFPELWASSSVVKILENPNYLGHTVNFRTRKKSYKSKKTIDLPPEEWVTFEDTHEAIIDEETFATVQKIREARHRPSKMGETSAFSGLLYCADCGKRLTLQRRNNYKFQPFFLCSSYRKKKKSTCTSHRISLRTLEKIVLIDLQRVFSMAKEHEKDFLSMLQSNADRESRKKLLAYAQEKENAERRVQALDRIIRNLYEDKVNGNLSDERFRKLSQEYEEEQNTLTARIRELQEVLAKAKEQSDNVTRFMRLIRKYTEITELTSEIIHEFIEKVIVHEKQRVDGKRMQAVEIIYNCVGAIPDHAQEEAA